MTKLQAFLTRMFSHATTGIDLSNLFAKLDTIKKTVLDDDDYFKADADDENDIAILERDNNKSKKVGIFSLKSKSADVKVDLPDGDYKTKSAVKQLQFQTERFIATAKQ